MSDEWVFGTWKILPEDRQPTSCLWTLFPAEKYDSKVFTTGPFGRKSQFPEALIDSEGIESEGLFVKDGVANLVVTAVNEYNKRHQ